MKIAYVTVEIPYGKGEAFIIPEIKEVQMQGNDVIIFPLRPRSSIFHKEAEVLEKHTRKNKLIDMKILISFIYVILMKPVRGFRIIYRVLTQSRNLRIMVKNVATIPKAFYDSKLFLREGITHIHAHWGTTTSTLAYITSYLTNIPWSLTVHRWDIAENNLLKAKVKTASFIRVINENSKDEVKQIIKDNSFDQKITNIHMGVDLPEPADYRQRNREKLFTILCPAILFPKKGHKYLIESCNILKAKGYKFRVLIVGDGVLRTELETLTKKFGMEDCIEFLGMLPHEVLMKMYSDHIADIVVLPSINIDNDFEGIPVSLMEAMAYGLPVVSTYTGGIPELVENAGLLVPEKDSQSLSVAIQRLMTDKIFYNNLSRLARQRVQEQFNIGTNVKSLVHKMQLGEVTMQC